MFFQCNPTSFHSERKGGPNSVLSPVPVNNRNHLCYVSLSNDLSQKCSITGLLYIDTLQKTGSLRIIGLYTSEIKTKLYNICEINVKPKDKLHNCSRQPIHINQRQNM
jgi:hypothetical protein